MLGDSEAEHTAARHIYRFARHLLEIVGKRPEEEVMEWAEDWHEAAAKRTPAGRPVPGFLDFTADVFCTAWEGGDVAKLSSGILEAVWARAVADRRPFTPAHPLILRNFRVMDVARFLILYAEGCGGRDFRLSCAKLARIVGVDTRTASRWLTALAKYGPVVTVAGKPNRHAHVCKKYLCLARWADAWPGEAA